MAQRITFRRNDRLTTINPHWRGNPSVGGRFFNKSHRYRPGMMNVLKWRLSPNPQRHEKRTVKWEPDVRFVHSFDHIAGNALVWLGHNSFFLQMGGKRIMFDPVFGSIPFVHRESRLPAWPSSFRHIDYLLISHDHFDHLDKYSVGVLHHNNPQMKLFCGLGTGELVKRWFPDMQVVEAGWYQQLTDGGLKLTFLPAQHWSKRSISDGGRRLWGAFMVQADGLSLYYGGDTGYGDHFAEIPELFGSPDYALLGIGAYKPRWFMRANHISPYDSLKAAREMGAGVTIPMHYGTFDLSDEPLFDPPQVFREEARLKGVNIEVPMLGEIVPLHKIRREDI
jgi:L-ascorbate metabolism protein UlaG (beta-lactamase superfamily)